MGLVQKMVLWLEEVVAETERQDVGLHRLQHVLQVFVPLVVVTPDFNKIRVSLAHQSIMLCISLSAQDQ